MQVMKQRFARNVLRELRTPSTLQQPSLWQGAMEDAHIWQKRFYDFVVLSEKKKLEKLRYIHRNPVRRGLVLAPEQWKWSSYPHYSTGELGPVFIDQGARSVLKIRSPHSP
jgi:REP element-mobilizing transposase RayT